MSRIIVIVAGVIALSSVAVVVAWIAVAWTVETPPYEVAAKDGRLELRDYPAMRVAEIKRLGSRRDAVRAGFRPLAGYIFARDRDGDSIAMTAPVTQVPQGDNAWTVQFIMPQAYPLESLPAPVTQEIALREWPARRMAVIRFGGVATDALIADKEASLRSWLAARGLEAAAPPVYAYYNVTLTPGFLRRNEVLIPIVADPSA